MALDLTVKPYVHRSLFFLPFVAVALSSVIGGFGAGVLSCFLSALLLEMVVMKLGFSFRFLNSEQVFRFVLFLPSSLLVAWVGGKLKNNLRLEREKINKLNEERLNRERFMMGLTHDLRTPLSAVKLNLELGRRGIENRSVCEKSFSKISESVDRANKIIEDLLDVSRSNFGKGMILCYERFNLVEVIKNAVERDQGHDGVQVNF